MQARQSSSTTSTAADELHSRVETFLKDLKKRSTFANSLGELSLTKIDTDGTVVVKMHVDDRVINLGGTLHGGAIATAIDFVTTISVVSMDSQGRAGVSTDLSVSYLRAAPKGTDVYFHSQVTKMGKNMGKSVLCSIRLETMDESTHSKISLPHVPLLFF
jgi:acyl-coenzyme A thioesterase 13